MPTPLEKSSELVDCINAMIESPPSETQLSQLEHEIDVIEKSGFYYQAKQLQGMLAGIRGDIAEVHRKFHAAIQASGNNALVRENYAQALANLHHFREAAEQISIAVELAPDNVGLLIAAQVIYENAYHVDAAEEVIDLIRRLGQESLISSTKSNKLVRMRQLLEGSGTTWLEISGRIELASNVLSSMGLRIASITESYSESAALMEFNILSDIDTAMRAEDAIHHAVADQPYCPADRMLAFACLPA